MRERYQQQVKLLLDVLPFIARSEVFSLKGGTAINFFHLDCPRLSVDIDLHYLPVNDRDTAMSDIHKNMWAIAESIEHVFVETTAKVDPGTFNTVVSSKDVQIKIQPNTVIRGCLLPVEEKSLSPNLEQIYGKAVTVPCVAKHELYAGKLCAALGRQHPRDLFDMLLFLQGNNFSQEMMDVFVVYLISQGKPIHEQLNPNIQDIVQLFNKQFVGMTTEVVALERLIEVQNTLPRQVLAALNDSQREFLLGFKSGIPNWNLLPFNNIQELPAVRWKQQNLEKMDVIKKRQAMEKLQQLFSENPHNPSRPFHQTDKEQTVVLTPQEQLTQEIVDVLIENGLLDKAKELEVKRKFTAGQLKREDWSLYIERASAPDKSGDDND